MKKRLRKKLLKKEIEKIKKHSELQSKFTSLLYAMQNPDCKVGAIIKLENYET